MFLEVKDVNTKHVVNINSESGEQMCMWLKYVAEEIENIYC